MLLLRSSRLALLSRSRPAAASAFSSRSVVVAVASPSSRKAEECAKAKDERSSGSSKKRSAASVLSSSSSKQSAGTTSVAASALGPGSRGETSAPDRTSEALVSALQQQLPESKAALSSLPKAGEEDKKSKSEIQALAARLWAAYDAALTSHPVAVKSATSFVGFLLGDLIAQSIIGLPYDARRTLRLVAFGVLMDGPIGKKIGCLDSLPCFRASYANSTAFLVS